MPFGPQGERVLVVDARIWNYGLHACFFSTTLSFIVCKISKDFLADTLNSDKCCKISGIARSSVTHREVHKGATISTKPAVQASIMTFSLARTLSCLSSREH